MMVDPENVEHSTGTRRHRFPRSAVAQGVVLGSVIFVVNALSPTPQIGDSRLSTVTAWQFLHHFNLHLEKYPTVASLTNRYDLVKHSGHLLPFFPWPTMLFMAPADVLYALTGHNPSQLAIGSSHGRTWILEVPTASLIVAVTAVIIYFTVLGLGGRWGRPRVAVATVLTFAFCTSAWSVGSRALFQQTVSMLFLAAIFFTLQRLERARRWPWILGVLLALSFMTRPTNAVVVVLVFGLVAWKKRAVLLPIVAGFVICMTPFLLFSYNQYGQFLPPYYQPGRLGQAAPFSFGNALLENLISPSRGLILYDPVVLLAVLGLVIRIRMRKVNDLDLLIAIFVCAQWIVIAAYGSTGGATYGPRLMLDTVPYLTILSIPALSFLMSKGRLRTGVLAPASRAALCWLSCGACSSTGQERSCAAGSAGTPIRLRSTVDPAVCGAGRTPSSFGRTATCFPVFPSKRNWLARVR